MIKQIIIIILLLLNINLVIAGEIVTLDNDRVFIYDDVETFVYMSRANNNQTNYNRTICINSTVIEGEISIAGSDNYELEYNFIADINESSYISRILIIKQHLESSSLLGGKVLNRTLILDGITIGNYLSKCSFWGQVKKNSVYFCLIDNNIRFGSDIIINESLAFTQLNYPDQQEYLSGTYPKASLTKLYHKYHSVADDGRESIEKLSGLTGIIFNVIGKIPTVGKSIQSLIFLPLSILQFVFNFVFTFIILISTNWWYALMTIEIMCIIPTFKHHNYSDVMDVYIQTHISIFNFIYEKIVLTIIALILRLIEIIRNIFRI